MRLQVNNSGSWKNVSSFEPAALEAVKACATLLGVIDNQHGGNVTFRVIDGLLVVVCAWTLSGGWRA